MRNGLTLIELILSMVIIGVVFTVIPRLILSMNQSTQVTIKEEAMYNALAQIGMITALPWDNNNTQNSQILGVTHGDGAYECNTTSGYRIGGFVGGRNCIAPAGTDFNAGGIGREDVEYNDIDDYHDINITADKNCSATLKKGLYVMETSVAYVDDPQPLGSAALNTVPKGIGESSNTKYVRVQVKYGSDARRQGCITALEYHSFNIGHIQINSRSW